MANARQPLNLDNDGLDRAVTILRSASADAAKSVIDRLNPEAAAEIRRRLGRAHLGSALSAASPSGPFAFLSDVAENDLIAAIRQERTQTIAVLLSAMPVEFAPRIVAALDLDQRMDVIARLAELGCVDAAIVTSIAQDLQECLKKADRDQAGGVQVFGAQRVARILAACDRSTEWSLMRSLGKRSPQLTEKVQQMLFDFEDIAGLSDAQVQSLAKNVETESWATALQRCSDVVREKVVKNLSPRAAQHLRAEMNYLGEAMPSEIDQGQQRVIDVARKLASATNPIRRAA